MHGQNYIKFNRQCKLYDTEYGVLNQGAKLKIWSHMSIAVQ